MTLKLTREEAETRIEGVLKAAGIKAEIWAIGEAEFTVEFPDGATYSNEDESVHIMCDGLSYQRG
jgi:hypothetical protein